MKSHQTVSLLAVMRVALIGMACALVHAAEPTRGALVPQESIKLTPVSAPGLPPGVLSALVFGNTESTGIYVLRNKWPPNSKLAPHTHGRKWRIYTVIEGEVRCGFGAKMDEKAMVLLGPGGVASTGPTDLPHYFIVGPKGAVLNVVAEGPFVTEFVPQ